MPTSQVAGVVKAPAAAGREANAINAHTPRAASLPHIPPGKVARSGRLARHMIELIDRALDEDVGDGDVTTSLLVPEDAVGRALLTQKASGVLAGLRVCEAVFQRVDPSLRWHTHAPEGAWREGGLGAEVAGSSRSILTGERVALNFLQRLSGVATLTARYVEAVAGTGTRILDTR